MRKKELQEIGFITAIPEIVQEFKSDFLNCKTELYPRAHSLTEAHMLKVNELSQNVFGVDETDTKRIREFFLEEIIGNSVEHIMMVYTKMFENVTNREIKTFLMFKITKFKANNYDFFLMMVCYTVSQTTFEQKLEFFFELCNDFNEEMDQENCITFCRMFKGKPPDSYPITKEQFVTHFSL
jgi:hypothetical protein